MHILPKANSVKHRGFTLVEMLVVISIIAILASLMLPALKKSYDGALRVSCLNNLKTVGASASLYISDFSYYPWPPFDDNAPQPWLRWYDIVHNSGYLEKVNIKWSDGTSSEAFPVLLCPSSGDCHISSTSAIQSPSYNIISSEYSVKQDNTPWTGFWGVTGSRKMLNPDNNVYPLKPSRFFSPSGKIAFSERNLVNELGKGDITDYRYLYNTIYTNSGRIGIGPIHEGTFNTLFADNHVAVQPIEAFDSLGDFGVGRDIWAEHFAVNINQ